MRNTIAEKGLGLVRWFRPIGVLLQVLVGRLDDVEDLLALTEKDLVHSPIAHGDVLERRSTRRWSHRSPRGNPCKTTADWPNSIWPLLVVRSFRNDWRSPLGNLPRPRHFDQRPRKSFDVSSSTRFAETRSLSVLYCRSHRPPARPPLLLSSLAKHRSSPRKARERFAASRPVHPV